MNVLQIETPVHGRVLFEERSPERLLVGFHGYAETAEVHLRELERIPGIGEWSVAAVQALHPFYSKGGTVIGASWMTSLDRELAIGDNINYVHRVVGVLESGGKPPHSKAFIGFSQGVAMAARAAAHLGASGLIIVAGDLPPDVRDRPLPPTLLIRGRNDDWYTEEKLKEDLRYLTPAKLLIHDGGHEWNDEVRAAAGEFLAALKRSHPS